MPAHTAVTYQNTVDSPNIASSPRFQLKYGIHSFLLDWRSRRVNPISFQTFRAKNYSKLPIFIIMLFGVNMPRIEWAYWSSFYGCGSGQVTHTLTTMATSPIFMVMDRQNTSVTKVWAHLVMTYLEKEIKQELVALRWKRSDLIMKVLIKAINPAFPLSEGQQALQKLVN